MRRTLLLSSWCEEGERVEAKWGVYWYIAVVTKVYDGGWYEVTFVDDQISKTTQDVRKVKNQEVRGSVDENYSSNNRISNSNSLVQPETNFTAIWYHNIWIYSKL